METIDIHVNRQMDGVTFSLTPSSRKALKNQYPDAKEVGGLFVKYGVKEDFESFYGNIEKYVLPILLGLDEKDIQYIEEVNFIDSRNNQRRTVRLSHE